MANIGTVAIKDDKNNFINYSVGLKKFDVVDTRYALPGGDVVSKAEAEAMRASLKNAQGGVTGSVERTKAYNRIPESQIDTFLTKKTGSSQETAQRQARSLWLNGFKTAQSTFQF